MRAISALIAVCAVAGLFFVAKWRQRAGPKNQPPSHTITDTQIYAQLRMQALSGSRTAFNLDIPPADAPAWGVLMEVGFPQGSAATLLSLSDGTASLYTSTGGGIIGGVSHESVRRAATNFVHIAGLNVSRMKQAKEFPSPGDGRTVFYVLTESGVFTIEAAEADFGEQRHDLSGLFNAGQDVITQLRLVSNIR